MNCRSTALIQKSLYFLNNAFIKTITSSSSSDIIKKIKIRSAKCIKKLKLRKVEKQITKRNNCLRQFIVEGNVQNRENLVQNFVLEAHAKLDNENLNKLTNHIDLYKSKLFTFVYQRHPERYDHLFLTKCARLFQLNNCPELYDSFCKCDMTFLRPRLLLNQNSVDNLSSLEMRNKLKEFENYSKLNVPQNSYIFDNLNNEDSEEFKTVNNTSEDSDNYILSKTSTFFQFNQAKGNNNIEESNELNNVEDVEEEKLIVDEDFSKPIHENTSSIKKPNNLISQRKQDARVANNLNLLEHLQKTDDIFWLQQKGFNQKEVFSSNWVYLYDLPFEINDEESLKTEIKESFKKSVGEIKEILLFKYSDFFSISSRENSPIIPESLDSYFDPSQMNTEAKNIIQQQSALAMLQGGEDGDNRESLLNLSDNIMKGKDALNKKLKKTDKILQTIEKRKKNHLNRSYALLLMNDQESKKKALCQDLRLFGMYLAGRCCRIEDADFKFTLNYFNLKWGTKISEIAQFVNTVFSQNHMDDMIVEIPSEFKDKILTKFSIYLRFNSLSHTIKAIRALNNQEFQNRILKIQHMYGSLKCLEGKYYELIDNKSDEYPLKKIFKFSSNIEKSLSRESLLGLTLDQDLDDELITKNKDVVNLSLLNDDTESNYIDFKSEDYEFLKL